MKVAITDYQYDDVETEKKIISDSGAEIFIFQCKDDEEQLIKNIADMDAVIVQYAKITANVIQHLKHCKVLVRYGIGVDNIDVEAATKKGIYVANVPDYAVQEVSDHALSLILALNRKLLPMMASVRHGTWGYNDIRPMQGLYSSTLGLVGFGRIPQQVCRKALPLFKEVLVFDPYIPADFISSKGAVPVSFDQLCTRSDTISVHCPYTDSTRHLFNAETLKKMKDTAYLVNTARGGIVSQHDLEHALQEKEIAGAGLDVFETEPLAADSPLLAMPNVICTPHVAWYSEDSLKFLQRKVAEEVVNVLSGNVPRNLINKSLAK